MPRSGWVATGVLITAVGGPLVGRSGLLALALAAAAGVLAAWSLQRPPFGHALSPRAVRGTLAGGGLIALGIVAMAGRLMLTPPPAPTAGPLPGGDGPWSARIESIGALRAGQQPAVMVLDMPPALKVAGTLPAFPAVVPGDQVSLRGSLRAPPADDPYGAYLVRIGARATIRVTRMQLDSRTGDLGTVLEGLRRGADRALQLGVPEPEAGLASGILIGLRDRVDRDLSAAFTAVGATHVVAISGWNIAIVATSLAALAGRLARRRRVALTALAIVAYVAFVGPSPSVVRAAAMAGVVMLARELGRPSRAAAAIGWAVVALLTVDPTLVADVGFQLSALATVGLIAWGTPFSARLAGPDPGRLRGWLAESLGVSLAAQLATLPIVVLSFGRLSLISPVVNLAVVPLVAPAMGVGVVALAGGLLAMAGLPPVVATIVGLPAWLLFSLMVGVVRAGALLPFASVQLVEPWNLVIAGVAALGIAAVTVVARNSAARSAGDRPARARHVEPAPGPTARRPASWWRTRAGRILVAGLAGSVVAMSVVVVHRPDGIPKVTVLDVGQGDAILVEGGRGGRLLVDGGPDPSRLLVALDEHLPPWDRRIDLVILSHPHEDHAAGLAALLQRYEVDRVLEPGMFGPGPGYGALNAELATIGIARGTLSTGNQFAIDEFRFRVLWPDPGTVPERPLDNGTGINNVSIVLLGEVNGHRLLLAGDIEEQIDPQLLSRGLPTVDFLKVAHHGSRTASTGPMIQALQPSLAVISAGRGNPYGHPAAPTVDRLGASGARVLRTDLDGSVTVELGLGPLRVLSSGARIATGEVALVARPPGIGTVTSRSQFLCGLPVPSLGIVALASPAPPSGAPSTVVAIPAVVPVAPIQIWNFIPRADLPGRLGYDAVHDPNTTDRPSPASVALAGPRPGTRRIRRA